MPETRKNAGEMTGAEYKEWLDEKRDLVKAAAEAGDFETMLAVYDSRCASLYEIERDTVDDDVVLSPLEFAIDRQTVLEVIVRDRRRMVAGWLEADHG